MSDNQQSATTVAVLLNWRRPQNLPLIINRLLAQPFCEHVVIWNNGDLEELNKHLWKTSQTLEEHSKKISILTPQHNVYTLGRFLPIPHLRNAGVETILTCDDDALVNNWPEIYAKHRETGRLVACLAPGHYERRAAYRHCLWGGDEGGIAHEMLLGWGAAFPAAMADRLFSREQKFDKELFARKADRLFTMLQEQEHVVVRADFEHLPGAMGREALYRQRDHWRMNREAVKAALAVLEEERGTAAARKSEMYEAERCERE